jgi:hypothetical protein
MRDTRPEQAILDFYTYPPIGGDDWRYTFETAQVRALEMQMLSRATFLDMANAESFEQAADLLGAGEYALPQARQRFAEVEELLRQRRAAVRELFEILCIDKPIIELFRTRDDFANLRLAVRRTLTEKPVEADYSDQKRKTTNGFLTICSRPWRKRSWPTIRIRTSAGLITLSTAYRLSTISAKRAGSKASF